MIHDDVPCFWWADNCALVTWLHVSSYRFSNKKRLISFTAPTGCLSGDHSTPTEIIWYGKARFEPVQLKYEYDGRSASYWCNAVVLCIGVYGIILHHGTNVPNMSKKVKMAQTVHAGFCAVAAVFCAIATYFTIWRWHNISQQFYDIGDYSLRAPYILSVFTCYLQVLPGSASLFAPILLLLSITEGRPPKMPPGVKVCSSKSFGHQQYDTNVTCRAASVVHSAGLERTGPFEYRRFNRYNFSTLSKNNVCPAELGRFFDVAEIFPLF